MKSNRLQKSNGQIALLGSNMRLTRSSGIKLTEPKPCSRGESESPNRRELVDRGLTMF